jgi:predicted enzyme related to lactoylglutathione lyase/CheY-like chemotaxis protein
MNDVQFFEIQATDPNKAQAFYTAVFGWSFMKQEGMPIDYWQITTKGINGGLLGRPAPVPPQHSGTNAFVCSMEVANFDDTAQKILANSGIVALEKFAVPGKCWQGYFLDTEGNTFGLFQVDPNAGVAPSVNISAATAPAEAPAPADDGMLKVVIVEDNAALADIYKTRLELLEYRCFVAYDGEEALAVIKKERPNLVLLDLMVPKVAGDQILTTMRANEWGKAIKVLIVSNLNEADAPAGLRKQGIEGYAVKANLSNDMLDNLVNRILKPEDQKEDVSLEHKEDPHQVS